MKDEYIRKADAVNACFDGWNNAADDCARNIKCLPSADVAWLCDTCGYRVEYGQPMYNFCPNCGAKMDAHGRSEYG